MKYPISSFFSYAVPTGRPRRWDPPLIGVRRAAAAPLTNPMAGDFSWVDSHAAPLQHLCSTTHRSDLGALQSGASSSTKNNEEEEEEDRRAVCTKEYLLHGSLCCSSRNAHHHTTITRSFGAMMHPPALSCAPSIIIASRRPFGAIHKGQLVSGPLSSAADRVALSSVSTSHSFHMPESRSSHSPLSLCCIPPVVIILFLVISRFYEQVSSTPPVHPRIVRRSPIHDHAVSAIGLSSILLPLSLVLALLAFVCSARARRRHRAATCTRQTPTTWQWIIERLGPAGSCACVPS